jgi:CRP/FNR family cyclic AMP-dependent transcriptional regulator
LTGAPRRVGLQAVTDCTLASLSLPEMNALAAKDPETIRRFACIAMLNIDLALLTIEDLLRPEPVRRVASVMWRGTGGQSGCSLPVTQGELRQLANTSRKETLAALKRLDELGAIRRGYATIEIKDPV